MQKLAREQGSTILLVTHNIRILDIARIVHLEDGRLANNTKQNNVQKTQEFVAPKSKFFIN